jgi:hypothetical protein
MRNNDLNESTDHSSVVRQSLGSSQSANQRILKIRNQVGKELKQSQSKSKLKTVTQPYEYTTKLAEQLALLDSYGYNKNKKTR